MKLANRIRAIREASELTQADIAYKLDISPSAYGQIERKADVASFKTLIKVAKAIGVNFSFLIDIEDVSIYNKQGIACLKKNNLVQYLQQQK